MIPATGNIRTHATPAKEHWPAPESSGAGHVTPNHAPHQSVDRNPFALSLSKGLMQTSSRPKSAPSAYKKASPPRKPGIPAFTRKREPGPAGIQRSGGTSRPPTPSGNRTPPPSLRRRGRSRTARPTTPRQHPPHPGNPSFRHSRESVNPGSAGIQRGGGTSRPPTPSGNRTPPPSLRRRGRSRTARLLPPRAASPRKPVIPVFTRKREPGASRNPAGRGTPARQHPPVTELRRHPSGVGAVRERPAQPRVTPKRRQEPIRPDRVPSLSKGLESPIDAPPIGYSASGGAALPICSRQSRGVSLNLLKR